MRKFLKTLFSIIVLFSLFNCQVNEVLRPKKFPTNKKEVDLKVGNEELQLKFVGNNLQPYFFKNQDTLKQNLSIKSYFFKTESGRKINAWLINSKTEMPKISVFALHGNSGNLNSQYQKFTELTKYGFQIFLFDYAGFGYSEGKSTRKNAVEDSFSAFEFFKNLDEIKNTPKIIYGQSIGGNFSIPVASKNQNDIEGLVLEGSFLNFKNLAKRKTSIIGSLIIKENEDNQLNLKRFNKPILIIHSKEDKVIPIEMGRKLYEYANEPKEFFEINQPHTKGILFFSKEISEKIYRMIQ